MKYVSFLLTTKHLRYHPTLVIVAQVQQAYLYHIKKPSGADKPAHCKDQRSGCLVNRGSEEEWEKRAGG